jgi:capsular exopolysaccharide synthesis family protein
MSRLFEALSGMETGHLSPKEFRLKVAPPDPADSERVARDATQQPEAWNEVQAKPVQTVVSHSVPVKASPESRLVALTDPSSLGAEKFRALVTRLDDLRTQRDFKSFQVTSSVINEGKSMVAGNVAATFANYSGSKTLLVEGDLHRPTLTSLLGLSELPGMSHWWRGQNQDIMQFVHRINDTPLWFLSAGNPGDLPLDILRSPRFAESFTQLVSQFEWIVVDSTPMLPIVDVNLWSKLVDGTLLVVREGLTPVKALKKGLQALDRPNLIGVVINEASGSDQENYDGHYYGARNPAAS